MYVCPYKFISGISCPGCGMTRAMLCALTLHFKEAFHYHPLFPVVIIWTAALILYHFKIINPGKKIQNIAAWGTIILFFAVYFIRLATGSDVISISPSQSIIYRIICRFGYSL